MGQQGLLWLALFCLVLAVQAGIRLSHKHTLTGKFHCSDGSKSILPSHVNNGVCDCEDGSDEFDRHCEHQRFACSGESKMIFKSRVNNGVCDCCDGSDEPTGDCPNNCKKSMHQIHPRKQATKYQAHDEDDDSDDEFNGREVQSRAPAHKLSTRISSRLAHLEQSLVPSSALDDVLSSMDPREDVGSTTHDELNASVEHIVSNATLAHITRTEPTIIGGQSVDDVLNAYDPSLAQALSQTEIPVGDSNSAINTHGATKLEESGDNSGYYTQPVMSGDKVVFVSEDDLWSVTLTDPSPVRLTSGVGQVWRPRISPDGKTIAFSGSDEGSPDVYIMPIQGGPSKRLTYTGSAMVVTWTLDGKAIVFSTSFSHFHTGEQEELFEVEVDGGEPQPLGVGWANYISYGPVWCKYCVKPNHPCAQQPLSEDKDSPSPCQKECKASYHGCMFTPNFPTKVPRGWFEDQPMHPMSILGRHTGDVSRWKRYRGGQRGRLFLDTEGSQIYRPFLDLDGNIGTFAWVHSFVVFTSDHHCSPIHNRQHHKKHAKHSSGAEETEDCAANLFIAPVEAVAKDKQPEPIQLTNFKEYVRAPVVSWSSDLARVTFSVGADIYYLTVDPHGKMTESEPQKIQIDWRSPRQQRQRRFVPALPQISLFSLSPDASVVAYLARGRPFVQPTQELGAAIQYGVAQGVRYTQLDFLSTGDLVAVSDENGEASIDVFKIRQGEGRTLRGVPLVGDTVGRTVGRVEQLAASPVSEMIAFVNHMYQLTVLDIASGALVCSLRSSYDPGIQDISWSPDGNWIAFTFFAAPEVSVVKIMRVREGKSYGLDVDVCGVVSITDPLVRDHSPSWDPDGNYLYFLSTRDFNPVSDEVSQRSMAFIGSSRPFLVTLNGAERTPFRPHAWQSEDIRAIVHKLQRTQQTDQNNIKEVLIDVKGIKNRIVGFPVSTGSYLSILGAPGKRALYIRQPLEPDLSAQIVLVQYDFITQQEVVVSSSVFGVTLSHDKSYFGVVPLSGSHPACIMPSMSRGQISPELLRCVDASRVMLEIVPHDEWRQILLETWRRARDNFWTGTMNGLKWDRVKERYMNLVKRIASRSELTDLIMQLQGELGTSHAFHKRPEHRTGPPINIGRLGCDVQWDSHYVGYRITALYKGDLWSSENSGPLARPGVNAEEGDVITKINGRDVNKHMSIGEMLLGKAGVEVEVTFLKFKRKQVSNDDPNAFIRVPLFPVTVTVVPLLLDTQARYRDWVNKNRRYIDEKSNGRVGYIHVPDMMQDGFAEFHRAYITQANREALIVDVRYNSGGFISENLLDKLSRKTLGYVKSRWGSPEPYPHYSTAGPKVALINEACGSDCDIFSQNFCDRMSYPVPCLDDVDPQQQQQKQQVQPEALPQGAQDAQKEQGAQDAQKEQVVGNNNSDAPKRVDENAQANQQQTNEDQQSQSNVQENTSTQTPDQSSPSNLEANGKIGRVNKWDTQIPTVQEKCMLIGQRTWGGVIGIDWKGKLVDLSATSQPEYAHWFITTKWDVENTGVHPNLLVEYMPHHYVSMYKSGDYEDPQLKRAWEEVWAILEGQAYQERIKKCVPNLRLGERA